MTYDRGGSLVLVASLRLDGNIIQVSGQSKDGSIFVSKQYEWQREQTGKLYVAKCLSTERNGGAQSTISYEVTDLKLTKPSPTLLAIDPTKLPTGVLVRDRIRGKRYRVGTELENP